MIGLEHGNGVLKTIEGTYDESTNTITVPTMPDTKDELQNTVNGSAESGVKVEITGDELSLLTVRCLFPAVQTSPLSRILATL